MKKEANTFADKKKDYLHYPIALGYAERSDTRRIEIRRIRDDDFENPRQRKRIEGLRNFLSMTSWKFIQHTPGISWVEIFLWVILHARDTFSELYWGEEGGLCSHRTLPKSSCGNILASLARLA